MLGIVALLVVKNESFKARIMLLAYSLIPYDFFPYLEEIKRLDYIRNYVFTFFLHLTVFMTGAGCKYSQTRGGGGRPPSGPRHLGQEQLFHRQLHILLFGICQALQRRGWAFLGVLGLPHE